MEIAKEIVLMTKEIVTILSMVFTTFFAFKTYQNNKKKASRKKKPRSAVSSIASATGKEVAAFLPVFILS